jgi:hypothetical protein
MSISSRSDSKLAADASVGLLFAIITILALAIIVVLAIDHPLMAFFGMWFLTAVLCCLFVAGAAKASRY